MAVVTIDGIRSLGKVENFTYTPDDRQTQIEVMDGTVVQDFGHNVEGDKLTFSTTFKVDDFAKIQDIWESRKLVTVVDTGGRTWEDCRVLIKSWQYVERFEQTAVSATFEIWRV
ncbi:hypothetical protein SELR_18130 [Selenomonas ruminantium subsp. lactilytica TAM6421]|uniref:Uncharacterized protein n=1 Tax=Selenomonas ruminantium subsp. lactilytica (strain NBRC 103574 / TAM6421) TaxID=927704 RepID=I0GRY4_SELRL|nr:hypothetical protein [Selenomonas ruminantium]BAL83521.1 hypothetical protein SELR_18130 [Selenomonas ruminantium subsp. lactilytica TAM6421]